MTPSIQITSRHIELTEKTIERIERRARALARVRGDLVHCHVVVDDPHQSRRRGRRYRVRVHVELANGVLITEEQTCNDCESDNLELAIAHAFRAAKRQLSDRRRRRPARHFGRGGRATIRRRALREAMREEGVALMGLQ